MPTSLLDKIRTALRRPTSTTAQLADALADAHKANAEALAAVEKQAAVVADGFMDSEAKRASDRSVLALARDAAEDAAALLTEVDRRHQAALDAEEQGRRRLLYESARASAAEAAAALARDYPALVKGAMKMLKALAEVQRDVQAANAQLPVGLPAIDDPEHMVRARAYRPTEIISESEMTLWTRHDMATPVDEPFQSEIYEAAHGWGQHPNHEEPNYLRVRYLRREVCQPVYGSTPIPLAVAIRLPALQGDGLAWGAPDIEGSVNPVILAAMAGQAYPDVVLAKMHEEAPSAPSKANDPEVRVSWEMLEYIGATPLKPAPYEHYHATAGENPDRVSSANPRPIGTDLVGLPGLQRPALAPASMRLVQPGGGLTRVGGN